MESKLATRSRRSLLEANQRLTPTQRLDAYVVHCRLMFDLYQAGQRVRALLRVVGREDFIAMKLFAHAPQDLADAEFAFLAAGESLDVPLLERLAQRYGTDTEAALRALRAKHPSR